MMLQLNRNLHISKFSHTKTERTMDEQDHRTRPTKRLTVQAFRFHSSDRVHGDRIWTVQSNVFFRTHNYRVVFVRGSSHNSQAHQHVMLDFLARLVTTTCIAWKTCWPHLLVTCLTNRTMLWRFDSANKGFREPSFFARPVQQGGPGGHPTSGCISAIFSVSCCTLIHSFDCACAYCCLPTPRSINWSLSRNVRVCHSQEQEHTQGT